MRVFHTLFALLAGLTAIAVFIAGCTLVLKSLIPEWTERDSGWGGAARWANLGLSAAASVVGGSVTAALSKPYPVVHVFVLALVVLVLSALGAIETRGRQPLWYQLLLTAIPSLAVFCGGQLQAGS